MADVCFAAACSQTSRVTGIPMHGTRLWPGTGMQACDGEICMLDRVRGSRGPRGMSLAEEQTFQTGQPLAPRVQLYMWMGTTAANSKPDAKKQASHAKDQS